MARIWDLSKLPYLEEHQYLDFQLEPSCDDVVAIGGNLSPGLLLSAYQQGLFPWYNQGQDIYWWSPRQRFALLPANLHLPKSLVKQMRRSLSLAPPETNSLPDTHSSSAPCPHQQPPQVPEMGPPSPKAVRAQKDMPCKHFFRISLDQAFANVIGACAATPRLGQFEPDGSPATWITSEMQYAYIDLHMRGYAHSVECWMKQANGSEELVGGLYGVSLGRCFYGESMFSHVPDASKISFAVLVLFLDYKGFQLIDCQQKTKHLQRFGADYIPRDEFQKRLMDCQPQNELDCQDSQRAFWQNCRTEFPHSPSLQELLAK